MCHVSWELIVLGTNVVGDSSDSATSVWDEAQISRDWARRVILAVGEREARLEAMERFRGVDPPCLVCPECREFGCSTSDALGEHLRDNEAWHVEHAALEVTTGPRLLTY